MSLQVIGFDARSSLEIARQMVAIAKECKNDCLDLTRLSLLDLFSYVKNIPYIVEEGGFQSLSRPYFTMCGIAPYTACANKSIIVASYCELLGYEWSYLLCGLYDNFDYHHVYPVVYIDNQAIHFDATYPENVFGNREKWQKEILVSGK